MDEGELRRVRSTSHLEDARGTPVTLLDPYLMHKLRRHDVIPAELLAGIARRIGSGWALIGRIIFAIAWPAVIVCLVIAHLSKWGGGLTVHPRELRLWLVLSACFVMNVLVVWLVARSGRLARVRRVMLEFRGCPHCGYDIRGLPVDPNDGATVCPECGCAWRLNQPAQSEARDDP